VGQSLAFGYASAPMSIKTDRVDFVEIGHGPIPFCDIAQVCDRCDISIHGIN
jgi:hypothetical protein